MPKYYLIAFKTILNSEDLVDKYIETHLERLSRIVVGTLRREETIQRETNVWYIIMYLKCKCL